jgi:hypothetical protein
MSNDPYYFPFENVDYLNLIPGDEYYIKLNDKIIESFLNKIRKLPVSHIKGQFLRLHNESDNITNNQYAVFKNVRIMNKNYKRGLCNQMLVRYPDGFLAGSSGCDSFSDNNPDPLLRRNVNEDREVFLNVKKWVFGIPTEQNIMHSKAMEKLETNIEIPDMINQVREFKGTIKSGGRRYKKNRKTNKKRNKKRKTYKRH